MIQQKNRPKRGDSDLPVKIVLYNSENDTILAGPTPAFVHDLSYYGAGLLLKKVFFPPHHLFYSPRDNTGQILCIEKKRNGSERDIIVPVNPVWMRLDEGDTPGYFRMGVEFMTDPEDIDVIDLEKMSLASFDSNEDLLTKLVNLFH
jgi:hypothetical protein